MAAYSVYLAGPMDSGVAERWRSDLISANVFTDIRFIDPIAEDEHPVVLISESDGMIVHYEHDEDQSAVIEQIEFAAWLEIPIVLWIDRYRGPREEIPDPIRENATSIQRHGRRSINQIMELL